MNNIPINWRLRKQRYSLKGQKCPVCNAYFFPPILVCSCGYRFDICPICGCQYNKKCENIIDIDILNTEIGC
jgi:hypothetical protein